MKEKFKRDPKAESLYRRLDKLIDAWKCEPYRRLSVWSFFFRRFYVITRIDMSRRLKHGIRDYARQIVIMGKEKEAVEAMELGLKLMQPKSSVPMDPSKDSDGKDLEWGKRQELGVKRLNKVYKKAEKLLVEKADGDHARMMSMWYMTIGRTCMLLKHRGLVQMPGEVVESETKGKPSLKQYNDGKSSRKDFLCFLAEAGLENVLVDAARQVSAAKRPKEAKEIHDAHSMDSRPAPEAVPAVP